MENSYVFEILHVQKLWLINDKICLQIDYPEVHSGRMHRPPHPHPITDHRQVNLVFEDTVSITI